MRSERASFVASICAIVVDQLVRAVISNPSGIDELEMVARHLFAAASPVPFAGFRGRAMKSALRGVGLLRNDTFKVQFGVVFEHLLARRRSGVRGK
jgi:hypothetical protein